MVSVKINPCGSRQSMKVTPGNCSFFVFIVVMVLYGCLVNGIGDKAGTERGDGDGDVDWTFTGIKYDDS